MPVPIIEVEGVTKEFRLGQLRTLKQSLSDLAARFRGGKPASGATLKALDDVSFTIEAGEVLGIIGHNGAGKSTLLKILAGISKPTRGRVAVRGKVAPLIEVGAGLVPDLTGRENIRLNATILGMKRAEIERKFDEIVAFAELEAFIDTPVKRYSSGMLVRLGFAIATSVEAEILIVDEVLAVGDLAFQSKCFDRMENLIKHLGRTVLLVSHDLRQVERISGRAIMLTGGRLTRDGPASEVCRLLAEQFQLKALAQQAKAPSGYRPRTDTGDIQVLSVQLLDATGAPTGQVSLNGAATIRVTFASARRFEGAEITIGVHTPEAVYVFAASTNAVAQRPTIETGESAVECSFERVPLKPGPYNVRLGFFDWSGRPLWYGEGLSPFVVSFGDTDMIRKAGLWLVDVPATWRFETPSPRPLGRIPVGSGAHRRRRSRRNRADAGHRRP
jgi:ABC-type polysaccharide/polyol phosphate transport system ATPase subunit